jgi:hypothetical protein
MNKELEQAAEKIARSFYNPDDKPVEFSACVTLFQAGANYANQQKQGDLPQFLEAVKAEREAFCKKASDDWWMKIGVERVVFENVLIMYDQMAARLAEIAQNGD